MHPLSTWFIICSCNLLLSCISYRGQDNKDILAEPYKKPKHKVSVAFSNTVVVRSDSVKDQPLSGVKPIVSGYMLTESEYFLTTQSISGQEDFFFAFRTVVLASEQKLINNLPQYLYLGFSFLTLTVIPYYDRIERRLEVDVFKSGKKLKSYRFSDHLKRFSSLFLLPFWRYDPQDGGWYQTKEEQEQVDHNLVKHFLLQFKDEFL